MRFRLLIPITLSVALAICGHLPALDRWEANFRARVRASIHEYLPSTPESAERRALVGETFALPDSAYREPSELRE